MTADLARRVAHSCVAQLRGDRGELTVDFRGPYAGYPAGFASVLEEWRHRLCSRTRLQGG